MRWSAKLFTARGIDVRVHVAFLLIVALGATQWGAHGAGGAAFGALFMLLLFTCVFLHEMGHSLVAQAFGMKVKSIELLPIGGVARLLGKPKTARQEIAVALAGPLVNVVLAVGLGLTLWWRGYSLPAEGFRGSLQPSLDTMLVLLTSGNATLALFNLLPFFPLDGGRVLRALFDEVGHAAGDHLGCRLGTSRERRHGRVGTTFGAAAVGLGRSVPIFCGVARTGRLSAGKADGSAHGW